ncbi:MAG: AarF/UbiB family protein [Pseudomonadota bacterium]
MSVLRSLYQGTRAVQSGFKDMNRLREIATVMARHGFGALFDRLNLGFRSGASGDVRDDNFEERLVNVLQELGPTFVKFGQIMSTRPDLIPEALCLKLRRLQDHVSTVPYPQIAKQIEREFGRTVEDLFQSLEQDPLASASIAQVHAARTHAGDDVIVKVRRPDITRTIVADLSIMHMMARRIEDVAPEARLVNLSGMLTEFERSLARETDFLVEAASIERFGRNFEQVPEVLIPRVFADLTTEAVLTMERVHGTKLTAIDHTQVDVSLIARRYLNAAYKMIFHDGFFHGDLHPGNVFVGDDGRIALVDFGMVGRLTGSARDRIVDVLAALLREDLQEVARTFFELGVPQGPVDYPAFEAEVVDVMERHFVGRTISEIEIGAFFGELVDGALKFRIRMPSDYTMLFKALLTTEGLAREIAPDVNPVELARPFVEELIRERYSVERLKRNALIGASRAATFLSTAITSGQRILRALEAGDTSLRLDAPELTRAVDRNTRARDRQTLVLAAALLVAVGAFLDLEQPALLLGLSLPSLILIAGSVFLLTLALLGVFRRSGGRVP